MATRTKVYIVDVQSVNNPINGDRSIIVSNGKILACDVDLVGVQTLQINQAQEVSLDYAIDIPRIHYNYQKYCFFNNTLFEVQVVTKAKLPTNMLLNVSRLIDDNIFNAITSWLGGLS